MGELMINQYKRNDVYKCMHLSHKRFGNRVSVHHVLKIKKCYPNGCISFEGICRLVNKGQKCKKGYNYVGVNCSNCSYFIEQKIMRIPEIVLNQSDYENFTGELDCFEDWIQRNQGKRLQCKGIISWIKPSFEKRIYKKNESTVLKGFIIGFKEGYIDIDRFDDYLYAMLNTYEQDRWRLSRGDEIEFSGILDIENGMVIFRKIRNIEIIYRAQENAPPTSSDAKIASAVGKILINRDEKCVDCPSGSLIYLKDFTRSKMQIYRRFLCSEGYEHSALCERISLDLCAQEDSEFIRDVCTKNKIML